MNASKTVKGSSLCKWEPVTVSQFLTLLFSFESVRFVNVFNIVKYAKITVFCLFLNDIDFCDGKEWQSHSSSLILYKSFQYADLVLKNIIDSSLKTVVLRNVPSDNLYISLMSWAINQ